jgi:hypothetical protein
MRRPPLTVELMLCPRWKVHLAHPPVQGPPGRTSRISTNSPALVPATSHARPASSAFRAIGWLRLPHSIPLSGRMGRVDALAPRIVEGWGGAGYPCLCVRAQSAACVRPAQAACSDVRR